MVVMSSKLIANSKEVLLWLRKNRKHHKKKQKQKENRDKAFYKTKLILNKGHSQLYDVR